MSDKTREVPQLADTTYCRNKHLMYKYCKRLHFIIKSTHEYKVHGPYGSNFQCTIGATGPLLGFRGSGPKFGTSLVLSDITS